MLTLLAFVIVISQTPRRHPSEDGQRALCPRLRPRPSLRRLARCHRRTQRPVTSRAHTLVQREPRPVPRPAQTPGQQIATRDLEDGQRGARRPPPQGTQVGDATQQLGQGPVRRRPRGLLARELRQAERAGADACRARGAAPGLPREARAGGEAVGRPRDERGRGRHGGRGRRGEAPEKRDFSAQDGALRGAGGLVRRGPGLGRCRTHARGRWRGGAGGHCVS